MIADVANSIINYTSPNKKFALFGEMGVGKTYHFDFYRLKNDLSVYDIGFEEYMSTADYCFIEWSEKILDLLPNNVVKLYLSLNKNERVINVNCKNE